jgi:O-methyltransferase
MSADYLELLKRTLADYIYDPDRADRLVPDRLWPRRAHTMLNVERLDNVRYCVETVLAENVPGDLIETGVWRGGACIFMRGILAAHGDATRNVWVADSFAGLPPPDPRYPADADDRLYEIDELRVSADQVRENFRRYGLLDERVIFLEGFFAQTLPGIAAERFAVVRLDGDMYESTMVALEALYPKLSTGGFLIVDDYGIIPACRAAVRDFRDAHGVTEEIVTIDWTGVYWRKSR